MHEYEYLPNSAFRGARWRKSSVSEPQQGCVEFTVVRGVVGIRDSKVPDGAILQFNREEIAAMLDGAKNGEFDDLA